MKTSTQSKRTIFVIMGLVLFSVTSLMSQDLKHSIKFNVGANGGNRIIPPGNSSYYFGNEQSMAGVNATFEYQKHFKKWISLSVGIDYSMHRHGATETFSDFDDLGNQYTYTYSMSYVRHNIGVPVRLYFNFINSNKVKLYSYVGLNVKFTPAAILAMEYYDASSGATQRTSSSLYDEALWSYGIQQSPVNLEAQTGLGMSYNFTPRFFIDANVNFGIDCFNTYFPGSFNEHQYRYGGNIGAGYNF